jgi:hypothetical protein
LRAKVLISEKNTKQKANFKGGNSFILEKKSESLANTNLF